MWSAVVAALLAQGGAAPSDWDCRLPQGIPGYEHEMASAPDGPGALEAAYRAAEGKLLAKVCGAADCPAVRAAIKPWRNGRTPDGKTVCALAVVPGAAVNAFLQSLRDQVE